MRIFGIHSKPAEREVNKFELHNWVARKSESKLLYLLGSNGDVLFFSARLHYQDLGSLAIKDSNPWRGSFSLLPFGIGMRNRPTVAKVSL